MAWRLRFWRTAKLLPGVRLNLSRSGPSVSAGREGSKVTVSRKGIRQSVGVPGTGLFATNQRTWDSMRDDNGERPAMSDLGAPDTQALDSEVVHVVDHVEPCGFCGGQIRDEWRCDMCGQPADRWTATGRGLRS